MLGPLAATANDFHQSFTTLFANSRPPIEVAEQIIQQVEQQKFYIFPDREVKSYCQERAQAIAFQTEPHRHSIEKIIKKLIKKLSK